MMSTPGVRVHLYGSLSSPVYPARQTWGRSFQLFCFPAWPGHAQQYKLVPLAAALYERRHRLGHVVPSSCSTMRPKDQALKLKRGDEVSTPDCRRASVAYPGRVVTVVAPIDLFFLEELN
eukprot:2374463-Rhodomonas_salina.2